MDKRDIFKIIFGKECVSDEELWVAGFGIVENLIEVDIKNISPYREYKQNLLNKKFLRKLKKVKTHWVKLPNNQMEQIKTIMDIITYGMFSLDYEVTVTNITGATIQFLKRLGYHISLETFIKLTESSEPEIADTKYLTAETVVSLANFINTYLFACFLEEKRNNGYKYVIIPLVDIVKDRYNPKGEIYHILKVLHIDFQNYDYNFISAHENIPLIFINLETWNLINPNKELDSVMRYLPPR